MAQCSLATGGGDPKVPAYGGGRLPLSTFLADRVRGILQDPSRHPKLPAEVRQWLDIQAATKDNVMLKISEFEGRPVREFLGIPIRTCDQIALNEPRVI